MLREWVHTVSTTILLRIVANQRVRGNNIWRFACEELEQRQQKAA